MEWFAVPKQHGFDSVIQLSPFTGLEKHTRKSRIFPKGTFWTPLEILVACAACAAYAQSEFTPVDRLVRCINAIIQDSVWRNKLNKSHEIKRNMFWQKEWKRYVEQICVTFQKRDECCLRRNASSSSTWGVEFRMTTTTHWCKLVDRCQRVQLGSPWFFRGGMRPWVLTCFDLCQVAVACLPSLCQARSADQNGCSMAKKS